MTDGGGTATSAVRLVDPQGPGQEAGAGLAVTAWFAKRFDRPFSATAIAARLPAGQSADTLEDQARQLGAVGLKSRVISRKIRQLDPMTLPCVLKARDGRSLILTGLTKRRVARVVDPLKGEFETEMPIRALQRAVHPAALLVARADDLSESRLDPDTRQTAKRHWFWGPVRQNWRGWAQIMLAALCLNLLSLALPLFVMNVYDKVIPNLAFVTLWTLAIGVAIALGFDWLLRLIRSSLLERISRSVDLSVAASLFAQAMRVRLLDRPGGAAGIAGTIRDFETVRDFFASASFVAVIDTVFIGIFIAALFFVVGPLAFVPLAAVPVVLLLALIAQMPISRSAERAQQMATKRHVVLIESLSGIETIKSVSAEPVMQREWETAVAESAQVNGRVRFWSGFATSGTILVQQAVSVAIIVWGVFLVSAGQISIGALIAANILAGRVLSPLGAIAQTLFRAQYAFKSLAALNRFMALPVEQSVAVTRDLQVQSGAVVFQSVSLTYPGARVPALNQLSFAIKPGETVVLLGKVGSGKSTTGKVLAGLLPPDSGTVLIDDIALEQYDTAELRAAIGYLPQEADLFTGTLRENLTLGAPQASDAEIHTALGLAAMGGFVSDHSEGLDFYIGEQGNRLSGGQRQGIALARLYLRKPKLLFLDEPTNAMDQAMEAQVARGLQQLAREGVGLILCTHRQSLTALADRLLVIDQGRAILDGPRVEVMARLQSMGQERAQG